MYKQWLITTYKRNYYICIQYNTSYFSLYSLACLSLLDAQNQKLITLTLLMFYIFILFLFIYFITIHFASAVFQFVHLQSASLQTRVTVLLYSIRELLDFKNI